MDAEDPLKRLSQLISARYTPIDIIFVDRLLVVLCQELDAPDI